MKLHQIKSSLKAKLLTLTTGDLIKSIPNGLRKRHTEIDMDTFGQVKDKICFGCAATNAILELLGIEADVYIKETQAGVEYTTVDPVYALELFYDHLRRGCSLDDHEDITLANISLQKLNEQLGKQDHFQLIKHPEDLALPELTNDFTEEHLQAYEKLANCQ